MNIGPSTTFASEINDFHSVVDSTIFYTNATDIDPPPPSGPLWFGYDGASVNKTNSTIFFSVNGKDLADTVNQGYLTLTFDSEAQDGILVKNSGYSGVPNNVSDHLLSYEESVLFESGTYYMRFQSDQNVPLRMYLFRTGGLGVQQVLLTQLVLGPNLPVILTAGSYSRIRLRYDSMIFQCPQTEDMPGTINAEISSYEFSDPINYEWSYMYIVHVPTITPASQLAVGRSI